jgi:signal transduction histidine kinase/DNA-binding response OmpR family regulator
MRIMVGKDKEPGIYAHEYRFLARAKEILANPSLNKDELLKEYAKIIEAYEALLKKFTQQGQGGLQPSPGEILERESHLFSGFSNEFRTPLALIITPLEQMLSTCRSQEQKKKLELMLRNAQRLHFLIEQVLALSMIESSEMKLKASSQNLISFLKGIMASFELLAEQSEVEFILDSEKKNITLYFDPEKIAEVMCNLIMNALRYTPAGGQVKVSVCHVSADSVGISVRDTGPGIPNQQLAHLFDQFYLLNKPFEHNKKGFGIGLYLVKEYINLHHGTIQVNSRQGEGTEFIIHLLRGKAHLEPDSIEAHPVPDSTIKYGAEISTNYAMALQWERDETHQPAGKIYDNEEFDQECDIVLVVEDSTDMRRLITTLLEKHFIVVEAADGKEGIAAAKKNIPDIIISDIIMPGVDGVQLCQELKTDINTSHIPIILLTARAAEKDIIRGLEAGADDYITKPFHVQVLLTRVKNLISLRRQLQLKIERRMLMQPEEFNLSELENLFLDKLQDLIEENLSNPEFGVDELAVILDISRPTLYRKVFALTGQSPKKFIQSYRLKRSFELLKASYGNVTEVAYKVGFSSSAYFTKCFKETFNRLPSDFITY